MNDATALLAAWAVLVIVGTGCVGGPSPGGPNDADTPQLRDAPVVDAHDSTTDGDGEAALDAFEAGGLPQTLLYPLSAEFIVGESVPVVDPASARVLGRMKAGDGAASEFLSLVDVLPASTQRQRIFLDVVSVTGLGVHDDRASIVAVVAGDAEVSGLVLPSVNGSEEAPEVLVASLDLETGTPAWACRVGPLPRGGSGAVYAHSVAYSRYGTDVGGSMSDYTYLDGGCPRGPLSTYIDSWAGSFDGWAASYSPDGRFLRGLHVRSPAAAVVVGLASSDHANILAIIGLIRDFAYILNVQDEEELYAGIEVPGPTHGQSGFVALAGPTGDPFWAAPVSGGEGQLVAAVHLDEEGVFVAGSRTEALVVQGTERLPAPRSPEEVYMMRFDPWGEFIGASPIMEASAIVEQLIRWDDSLVLVVLLSGEGRVTLPDGVRLIQAGADSQAVTRVIIRVGADGTVVDGRIAMSPAGLHWSDTISSTVGLGASLFSVLESRGTGLTVLDLSGRIVAVGGGAHTRHLMKWSF
jgi:hypothetical protein